MDLFVAVGGIVEDLVDLVGVLLELATEESIRLGQGDILSAATFS